MRLSILTIFAAITASFALPADMVSNNHPTYLYCIDERRNPSRPSVMPTLAGWTRAKAIVSALEHSAPPGKSVRIDSVLDVSGHPMLITDTTSATRFFVGRA